MRKQRIRPAATAKNGESGSTPDLVALAASLPLEEALENFFATQNQASSLYTSAREQQRVLRKRMRVGVLVPMPPSLKAGIPPGKRAVLKNNWAGKDEVFAGGYTRRSEIVLI